MTIALPPRPPSSLVRAAKPSAPTRSSPAPALARLPLSPLYTTMADAAAPSKKLLRLDIFGAAVATVADGADVEAGLYANHRRQSAPAVQPPLARACGYAEGVTVVSHTLVDCAEDAQNPLLGRGGAVDTGACASVARKPSSLAEPIAAALTGVPRARTLDGQKIVARLVSPHPVGRSVAARRLLVL